MVFERGWADARALDLLAPRAPVVTLENEFVDWRVLAPAHDEQRRTEQHGKQQDLQDGASHSDQTGESWNPGFEPVAASSELLTPPPTWTSFAPATDGPTLAPAAQRKRV